MGVCTIRGMAAIYHRSMDIPGTSEPNRAASAAMTTLEAHLWRRLAASVYDALLLVAIWMCGGLVVVLLRGAAVPPLTWWFEIYLLALAFGYFGWSWIRGGQTLGMRAWNIRVQRPDGSALDWGRAAVRFAIGGLIAAALVFGAWAGRGTGAQMAIGIAALALGVLALGWTLFDRQRRGWHDLAADTVVVLAPRRT
jgi:uncharacterized RDD family membrane protein YckC